MRAKLLNDSFFRLQTIFNHLVDNDRSTRILINMIDNLHDDSLSELLKAVSDTTRRSLLTKLCQQGTCRVTDLAQYYDMSLNAVSKHIKILEKAGLVTRKTIGRTHWIDADLDQVSVMENWFYELKSIWELRLDKLNDILKNGDNEND
ncbi:MAG: winged helix-turn-helix transcriptional regulator [Ectothiorhodospiraceae bacterium]|nr:winged helix-turn-helix transcriptional regulator [Ectothiorhodospiraceae bacterium]